MSTAGGSTTDSGQQTYYCYQCDREVTLTPSPGSDLLCPNCNGGFLEEVETPNPNPIPRVSSPFFDPSLLPILDPIYPSSFNPFPAIGPARGGSILFSSTPLDFENSQIFSSARFPSGYQESPVFDPFVFLQNYLQNLRNDGANVEFIIENHPSGPGFRLPQNIGDYFLGPGLEQLIQQLAENDPNRYGTPPASKKAVEGLPNVKITEELVKSDSARCAVCMNEFELGSEVKQMPCKHIFHSECILPWLELHNSCPVCRYELPTDDPDYESQPTRNQGPGSSSGGMGRSVSGGESQGGSERNPTPQRRFSISLPWPFSAFMSSDGNNDSGTADHEGTGSGRGPSSGGQSSSQDGSQRRQESLD